MEIKTLIALEDKIIYQDAMALLNLEDPFAPLSSEFIDSIKKQMPSIAANVHRSFLLNLIR